MLDTKAGEILMATGADQSSEYKSMMQIGSISVVQRLCMTFHLAGVRPIVVVASQEEQQILEKHLARMQIVFMKNEDAPDDIFYNAKLGLSHLMETCRYVFITPVNIPLFSVETIKKLLSSKEELAVPAYKSHRGHPLMIHNSLIPAILSYEGANGLEGALQQFAGKLTLIEVDDAGVYIQSNQFEECEKLAATHSLQEWRPVMKLRIAAESAFFGPGSWQLLSLIESTGSVRNASELMGVSYSKAWRILNTLEEQTGYPVLTRKKGGRGGGESQLTLQGKLLMEWFEKLERSCNQAINEIFEQMPPPQF